MPTMETVSRQADTVLVKFKYADGMVETRLMDPQRLDNVKAADRVLRKIDAMEKKRQTSTRARRRLRHLFG